MSTSGSPSEPAVSVVIGAYNAARWIGGTIESVLAQTYRDFELVVVDDGSTDETPAVVRRFGEAVRYIRKENGGSASARNRGIEEARGRYVAFLDADDLWQPGKLAAQMQLLEENPALAWCYTDAVFFASETGRVLYRAGHRHRLHEGEVLRPLLVNNFITFSTVVVQRKVLQEAGGFDTDPLHRISEDWDLWLRLAARHPVGLVRRPLTRMRHHTRRKTETMDLGHALESRLTLINRAVRRDPARLADLHDQAIANVYVGVGRKALSREARAEARWLFAQALRRAPADPRVWTYALAALLPARARRLLGALRRRVRQLQRAFRKAEQEA